MLLPTEFDLVPQKRSCQQNLIWPDGSASSKIIFTLLAKIVALHVRPTTVDIRGLGLEFVYKSTFCSLEERLDDSIQILLAVSISTRILGR